ncbi:hypothetical protein HMPREF9478_01519 [Enterococcus saccharolyticus 30_1]|uniref:Regulatory protein YycH-like domain-containing protein n=1 Tax=Enterococcus saccharolyticus 30_1 TaxID=742813 RepID=A0AA87FHZ1_9ENTE|nr:hypothetical protein HMPREF9478_01519 [Enterococcus saccharolyticus 30_1]
MGLNVFLFNIYSEARSEQQNVLQSNQTIPIEQRLASEDIKYSGELSDEYLSGYYLSGEQTDLAAALREAQGEKRLTEATTVKGQQLTHISSGGFYISDDTQAEKTVNEYLQRKDQVLYGDEYHYRKNLSLLDQEYPTIVASQSYETIPFNDSSSRIDMTLASSDKLLQIAKYTQTHISNITPLREKMTLYSEKEAVNTLYLNNKLPSHSKILWTELAYTRILIVGDRNVYIPAWFVAVKADADVNIQIETVNAFSNRIITNNAVQKVENP